MIEQIDIPVGGESVCAKEIIHRLSVMRETLQSVGKRFGITRERVRQIAAKQGYRRNMLRRGAAVELLEPFLAALGEDGCLLCGAAQPYLNRGICSDCGFILHQLRTLRSRLRVIKDGTPDVRVRTTAVWIIRHNDFRPDDIELTNRKDLEAR